MGFEDDVERRRSDLAEQARSVADRERERQLVAAGHARAIREELLELARYLTGRVPVTWLDYQTPGGRKAKSPEGFPLGVALNGDLLLPDGRVWQFGTGSVLDFEAAWARFSSVTVFGYTVEVHGPQPGDIRARIHVFDADPPWLTLHDMCVELATRAAG